MSSEAFQKLQLLFSFDLNFTTQLFSLTAHVNCDTIMTSCYSTMSEDWRYSDDRMDARARVYAILLKKFGSELNPDGSPVHSQKGIMECCHDWVSQGNVRSDGIVAYYKAYYAPKTLDAA